VIFTRYPRTLFPLLGTVQVCEIGLLRAAPFQVLHCSLIKSTLPSTHASSSAYRGLAMPRSWLSDDWFLPIMDIITWILAHGISHLTLVLSPLITVTRITMCNGCTWLTQVIAVRTRPGLGWTRTYSRIYSTLYHWVPLSLMFGQWTLRSFESTSNVRFGLGTHFACSIGAERRASAPCSHSGCAGRLRDHYVLKWKRSKALQGEPPLISDVVGHSLLGTEVPFSDKPGRPPVPHSRLKGSWRHLEKDWRTH
jgi:hypothetical protein